VEAILRQSLRDRTLVMTTQRKGRRALTLAVRAPPLAKRLHHVRGHDYRDGQGFSIKLDLVPLSGRIQMRISSSETGGAQ
jgi:hypothetical protein